MDDKDAVIQVLLQQRNSFLEQITMLQVELLKLKTPNVPVEQH